MTEAEKLVDGEKLLVEVFDESCRPTLRTLERWTHSRIIPSHKIGGLRLYYISEVREQLERRNKVKAR